ncbi:MAG TPA: hypothetical protein PKZ75_14500 [Bacteroidia bacterium]|nr:hypothetical protein [Bacteroidia bacterium]
MRQQFSLKPLKRKIQLATGGKRRKIKGSQSSANRYPKNSSYDKASDFKKSNSIDSTRKDTSNFIEATGKGFPLMDTVIRIYYEGLTDSVLNKYKKVIKSFVARNGTNRISEISLSDFYSEDGYTEVSVKSDIGDYLLNIGVSKYRLFLAKNKRLKPENNAHWPKKLLYLEIRFH